MTTSSKTLLASLVLAAGSTCLAQTDLLPDIITDVNDLYDNQIVIENGRRLLRLSNGTPNIGAGKLYLRGGQSFPDGSQEVWQRVYRTDNTFWEQVVGRFTYHPGHGHIHFDGWAQYNLREVLENDGVGDIIAQGEKTSFCILDLAVYDSSLPGFNPNGQFRSCGTQTQGLSVGWKDIYSSGLDGQWIDITDIPNGVYWLEAVVDPDAHLIESDATNNFSRIKVEISGEGGGTIEPDAYEPNESRAEVMGRPVGQVNSPHLGPCNPIKVIPELTIDVTGDDDYFRFYVNHTGASGDLVRVDFVHANGDIDMRLLNNSGGVVATSEGVTNNETISLNGRAEGWYYVHVYGYNGATNPEYTLTINPPANQAPSVTVVNPPAGDTPVVWAVETYQVDWTSSDPENDERWVSIYLNTTPSLDGNQIFIPESLNTPAALGFHVINTVHAPPGTYYVYAEITDGGVTTGSWSSGTITLYVPCPGDFNKDGQLNVFDFLAFQTSFATEEPTADMAAPFGVWNVFDFLAFQSAFGEGCP